jgi:hypothetical protein
MSKLRSFEEIIMGKSSRQLEARIEQSQQEFQHRQRANWSRLVPELAFVLLRCGADRKRVFTNEIASEAVVTYQDDFGYEKCPDQALVLLTLLEAKTVSGDMGLGVGFADGNSQRRGWDSQRMWSEDGQQKSAERKG